jgi:hypothetical protein
MSLGADLPVARVLDWGSATSPAMPTFHVEDDIDEQFSAYQSGLRQSESMV